MSFLVCYREREKAEIKDRKVLEILQMKDEKIEELQAKLTSRARELEESLDRYMYMYSHTILFIKMPQGHCILHKGGGLNLESKERKILTSNTEQ